jgi:integrase
MNTSADGPLHAFVAITLGCGLRLGEALGLRWRDLDLDAGVLTVEHALQRQGGNAVTRRPLLAERSRLLKLVKSAQSEEREEARRALVLVRKELAAVKTTAQLVEPKSSKAVRRISMPNIVIQALRGHRVRQLEDRLAAGRDWRDEDFVLATPLGGPRDAFNVHKQFKKLLVTAGLLPMRIHDLRHSCASLLLAQGVDPRTIMEILGHSQISLTMNTYAHVLPALRHDAAKRINSVFG